MARTAEIPEGDETVVVHTEVNEPTAEAIRNFVDTYEAQQDEVDVIMDGARKLAQPHRDQMKEIAAAAAEAGIPKRVLRAKIAERRDRRRAAARREALNEDQREDFDMISEKIGDLFEWAENGRAE